MNPTTKRTCPGCGRHFLPGGYTNHLKLTRDSRCKSIRDSVFRPPSNAPFHHSAVVPTPGPPRTPSPTTPASVKWAPNCLGLFELILVIRGYPNYMALIFLMVNARRMALNKISDK